MDKRRNQAPDRVIHFWGSESKWVGILAGVLVYMVRNFGIIKVFLVNANPLLPEQNRSRRIQLYNEGKQQHGNRQNQYPRKRQSKNQSDV